jgi:bifunctional DNA-binding transcriptional regulator/antitoxin component of YhaV-PrlF toxin-antitoxin module
MKTPESTVAEYGAEMILPAAVRDRYSLKAGVSVRIIETRDGILLIPLTDDPMPEEFEQELADWQELGAEAWETFARFEEAE